MKRALVLSFVFLATMSSMLGHAAAARWVEGRDYELVLPVQHTNVPAGKVEVLEVFSYACPWCNKYQPVIKILERNLPSNAKMAYLPAAFSTSEDWPMFQRAYYAAEALGVADKTHQAIFDAVWQTGELAIVDSGTNHLKTPMPSLEDAAHCYERLTGIKSDEFLRTAISVGVTTKMHAADAQIIAMKVPGTPCVVVAGKYRVNMESMTTPQDMVDIVKYLVGLDTAN